MSCDELFESLGKSFGGKIQNKTEFCGETTYTIAASDLREIAKFSRDKLSFDYFLDITSIDNFMKVFITGLVLFVALIINVVFSGRAPRDRTVT